MCKGAMEADVMTQPRGPEARPGDRGPGGPRPQGRGFGGGGFGPGGFGGFGGGGGRGGGGFQGDGRGGVGPGFVPPGGPMPRSPRDIAASGSLDERISRLEQKLDAVLAELHGLRQQVRLRERREFFLFQKR